jgi:hypothetical protein
MRGYAVEGRAALKQLEARAPQAAAWWRANVPHVLQPGFQFVFPAANCQKLVGTDGAKDPPPPPGPSAADLILGPAEVFYKAVQTERLLQAVAERDRLFDPSTLRDIVRDTFIRVQASRQERDYGPVRDLLLPGIRAQHEELLQVMWRHHEINRMEGLHVERLEFVHLYCPPPPGAQEFTALITSAAQVYFVDDRTGAYTRGERQYKCFQELWVFCRQGDAWRLCAIERSHASDRLRAENRVAGMTDAELRNVQRGVMML